MIKKLTYKEWKTKFEDALTSKEKLENFFKEQYPLIDFMIENFPTKGRNGIEFSVTAKEDLDKECKWLCKFIKESKSALSSPYNKQDKVDFIKPNND